MPRVMGTRNLTLPDRRRGDPHFAVDATVSGIDIATVGIILMIVGVIGLLISLSSGRLAPRRRAAVVERPVVRDREYY